jgi:hypothetical protein
VEQRDGFLEKFEQGFCEEISLLNQRNNRTASNIRGIAFIFNLLDNEVWSRSILPREQMTFFFIVIISVGLNRIALYDIFIWHRGSRFSEYFNWNVYWSIRQRLVHPRP